MSTLIRGENISFSYGGHEDSQTASKELLTNLNFTLEEGEVIGITGPSGCGKSTLCHVLSGIIPKVYPGQISGQVSICGKPIETLNLCGIAQSIGFVFQDPDTQLFSGVIEEDIAFGPENFCLPWEEIDKRIGSALETTGMRAYRYASPEKVSGGQRQLAAIASILALDPKILILDEAMAQLDQVGKELLQSTLCLLRQKGKGIILVEHDLESLQIADKILRMDKGKLIED